MIPPPFPACDGSPGALILSFSFSLLSLLLFRLATHGARPNEPPRRGTCFVGAVSLTPLSLSRISPSRTHQRVTSASVARQMATLAPTVTDLTQMSDSLTAMSIDNAPATTSALKLHSGTLRWERRVSRIYLCYLSSVTLLAMACVDHVFLLWFDILRLCLPPLLLVSCLNFQIQCASLLLMIWIIRVSYSLTKQHVLQSHARRVLVREP